ncbi:glycerol-3-phosphate dehydrogenase [Moniliophthora roreri MCA 2997]|uniref:Glycerol-3-phosphate dehydrogenase n=1 Tax=Moniliophthora roreri (strain MCA 2997) TaxID=1381753 RepID=V2Y5K8_MONRO|nr:glycerol-3-phosphate dehydrogenase [Moniliophthora roreri MCA 2997]
MSILRTLFNCRTLAYASGGTLLATAGGYWYLNSGPAYPTSTVESRRPPSPWTPPSRAEMLKKLKASDAIRSISGKPMDNVEEEFDLLIVGGGATGAGVAVDAASRGLKVALVERDDFASGTSSKSTKLVHGGVRYLQKAVMELDYEQYKLVREALHERRIFLQTAPYLSAMLPIMLPIYKYWQIPYYYSGCKMYDLLAGKENMESSYLMSKGKALETFPMLKSDGLVGALVYYDGQHNDSRMNIALILTAVKHGAVVANYTEVTQLHKDKTGQLNGARLKDNLTGEEWNIRAKGIINATGPFTDSLLSLDNPNHKPIVRASSGIHITLPNYYSPRTMGLLDPATSDGRVIFFLPWQGNTIAGTTDTPAPVEKDPVALEEEVRWILEEVRRYLSPDIRVRRGDVLSAWSGLRPLIKDPSASVKGEGGTQGLVRNHIVHISPTSRLLTIAGGKWTTYRKMAEETVDAAVKEFGLESKVKTTGCVTEHVRLVGSDGWSRNMFIGLIQRFGLETDVAKHLSENYGDRAWTVCSLAEPTGAVWPVHGKRLHPNYPFTDAEVHYAISHEYAQHAIDVLARRTRLTFLNVHAALEALPTVVDIMSQDLEWSYQRKRDEIKMAVKFFESMGLPHDVWQDSRWTLPEPIPRGAGQYLLSAIYKAWSSVWGVTALLGNGIGSGKNASNLMGSSTFAFANRARFDAGEVTALEQAFSLRAKDAPVSDAKGLIKTVALNEVMDILRDVPGYEQVSVKELDYVLEEAGLKGRKDVDFDEFVEICGNLKEVSFAPEASASLARRKRRAIPVEKSGGGV